MAAARDHRALAYREERLICIACDRNGIAIPERDAPSDDNLNLARH